MMERDLFGSILYLALQIKINMEDVLTYPLTATPLSLCHIDGKMYKATKNTSMKELEKSSVSNNTERIQVAIVKEMFFLHSVPIYLKHVDLLVDLYERKSILVDPIF